jgi:FkbM family methyltransferase
MKNLLKKYPPIFDAFKNISRSLGNKTELYKELKHFFDSHKKFTFIQIGGSDGITNDPFREFILRSGAVGVIVEPQPNDFSKLKQNYQYKKLDINFENCAVSYKDKNVSLFVIDNDFLQTTVNPDTLKGVASFDKQHVVSHVGINNEANVKSIDVRCNTIEELKLKYNFQSFDCIFLDVEGYEYDIITNMSFETIEPKLIVFESCHLGDRQHDLNQFLESNGYVVRVYGQDTIAIRA